MTTTAQRVEMLRASAAGLPTEEAAVGLLAAHAHWLDRADFTRHITEARNVTDPAAGVAAIDWPSALYALDTGRLPCSAGERRMLRLAASLADRAAISLGDAVTSLDHTNSRILVEAILHVVDYRM
ncbi:hypothetical protein [Frankia sp. Cr1]|uniref:hypothetical protein n=1 Tax=Frankia sp. Cr1 TaxID=3073931 RepID=UPI002AD25075|nr:hypothetical protein [Frankia sp. Cr1]